MLCLLSELYKHYKKYFYIPVLVVLYYIIGRIFDSTCPILSVFGVPCPACGMTRAMLSLFRLDTAGYIHYNAMALPMLIVLLCEFHLPLVKSKGIRLGLNIACVSVLVVNLVYYMLRCFVFGTFPV